jgi:serine/threonine protein phosphatase PrpC
MAHIHGNRLTVIHVGDSFMFRLRGGKLEPLTVEHNLGNELKKRIARGEPAFLVTENRSALTRCVGQPAPLEGDIEEHDLQPGDRYLVCSDGITRCVTPDEISKLLRAVDKPEPLGHKLVELANERGGVDNSTAVVVFVD